MATFKGTGSALAKLELNMRDLRMERPKRPFLSRGVMPLVSVEIPKGRPEPEREGTSSVSLSEARASWPVKKSAKPLEVPASPVPTLSSPRSELFANLRSPVQLREGLRENVPRPGRPLSFDRAGLRSSLLAGRPPRPARIRRELSSRSELLSIVRPSFDRPLVDRASLLLSNVDRGALTLKSRALHVASSPLLSDVPENERPGEVEEGKPALLFDGIHFVVALTKVLTSRKIKEFQSAVTSNGGSVSFMLTRDTSFVVTTVLEVRALSLIVRSAKKRKIPAVSQDFVIACLKEHRVVDHYPFILSFVESGKRAVADEKPLEVLEPPKPVTYIIPPITLYSQQNPEFSESSYQIIKVNVLVSSNSFVCIELHGVETSGGDSLYRVFTHSGRTAATDQGAKECRYCSSVMQAEFVFRELYDKYVTKPFSYKEVSVWSASVGSDRLMAFHGPATCASTLPQSVLMLLGSIYKLASSRLELIMGGKMTKRGFESALGTLSYAQIQKSEVVLRNLTEAVTSEALAGKVADLWKEFYSIIPYRMQKPIVSLEDVEEKTSMVQLMKDLTDVGEFSMDSADASYKALRCAIAPVASDDEVYSSITGMMKETTSRKLEIHGVFSVVKSAEDIGFRKDLKSKLLFHGSSGENIVGILSRGLLLPRVVTQRLAGTRSDIGLLGEAVYFSDSLQYSMHYAKPNADGRRFIFICEVAVGEILEVTKPDTSLKSPPPGYDCVKGVPTKNGQFRFPEYAIYSLRQERLRYLVEFSEPGVAGPRLVADPALMEKAGGGVQQRKPDLQSLKIYDGPACAEGEED